MIGIGNKVARILVKIARGIRNPARLAAKIYQLARIAFYKGISTNRSKGRIQYIQPVQLAGDGSIQVGEGVKVGVFPSPCFYSTYGYIEARSKTAEIIIGKNTWINNNFCALAEQTRIVIGKNCLIGVNVSIYDSDFHPLRASDRESSVAHRGFPVIVGNDVFIGSDVKILKGVTIGDGSVIGAGSVVVGKIPANSLAAGVPAKVIRKLQ